MDINKLLESAIRLGYKGAEAESFVQKQVAEYEEREVRAAKREREREREKELSQRKKESKRD